MRETDTDLTDCALIDHGPGTPFAHDPGCENPKHFVTVLDLARFRLGPGPVADQASLNGADLASVGLALMGGCEVCEATLACYNAYPSRSGCWRCADCLQGSGYRTVEEANAAIFADGVPGYRLEPDGTVPAVDGPAPAFAYPIVRADLPEEFSFDFCGCESSHCRHHGGRVEDGVPMCDTCSGKPSGRFSMDWIGSICDSCALVPQNASYVHPIVERLA